MPQYCERELFDEVLLCDERGQLNPDAVGWSRKPLHVDNMTGHWPRKKKWNHWVVTNDEFSFCASYSNVDYIGLAHAYFLELATGRLTEKTVVLPFGIGCDLPEKVEETTGFKNNRIEMSFTYNETGLKIITNAKNFGGKQLKADFDLSVPPDHESVNVVIPFDNGKFRFTSKQTAIPVSGTITIGAKTYTADPANTFACLDYNRSIIDYHTTWNWAVAAGRQGNDVIGLNFGAKWCYGRGITQNGLCLNGRLHKISEDVICTYNDKNFREPWTIKTEETDRVNLTIFPFHEKIVNQDLGIIKTKVHQLYSHFTGTIKLDNGRELEIRKLLGWTEEQVAKW